MKIELRSFLKNKVVGSSSIGRGGAAYTKSGIPDLLVCCNGYFVGVEVKSSKGKPSELQLYNIRKINESCGIGIVLYPDQFDDFQYIIQCLIDGDDMEAWRTATKINKRG